MPFSELKNSRLFYQKTGTGNKPLLLFHGFGQNHQAFEKLCRRSGQEYTCYSFDLFFHGQSEWHKGEQPLEKEFWKELMNQFLDENKIDRFSVLGFSMGGKFALAALEAFSNQIDEIILLAPDGIKTSFWYSLATYPLALRDLFKSMITHRGRFNTIANMAHQLGLVDKGILRFVQTQMNSEEKRKRVYYSWVVFRHLKFDLQHIANLINANKITLRVIIGRYDKIITAHNMSKLVKKVTNCELEILEAGHNDLIEKFGNSKSAVRH